MKEVNLEKVLAQITTKIEYLKTNLDEDVYEEVKEVIASSL